jgi:hypothetical protein
MKLGSPAVKNDSPRLQASAIFSPCLIFGAIVEICIAHLCDAFFFFIMIYKLSGTSAIIFNCRTTKFHHKKNLTDYQLT